MAVTGLRDNPASPTDATPLTLVVCAEMADGDCQQVDCVTGNEYMIGIDLGSAKLVNKLVIDISGGTAAGYIAAGPVARYSSDNSAWTQVSNQTEQDTEGSCADQVTVNFDPVSARYFRVWCSYQPYLLNIDYQAAGLEVQETYHAHYAEDPWELHDPHDTYHEHHAEAPGLTVHLAPAETHHEHHAENVPVVVHLNPAETYHEHHGASTTVWRNWKEHAFCHHIHIVDGDWDIVLQEFVWNILGILDENLPQLTLTARAGARADIDLPELTLEATGQAGEFTYANIILPKLILQGYGGGRLNVNLPKLTISGMGLTGIIGTANIELPKLIISANEYGEVLGQCDSILPKLIVTANGIHGLVGQGDITLYPISLVAEGYAGILGTLDQDLPELTVEASAVEDIMGQGDIDLLALEILAMGHIEDRFKNYILQHSRW